MRNTAPHTKSPSVWFSIWANGVKYLPGIVIGLLVSVGVAFAAQAAEPEACVFGLLECDESGIVWGAENIPNDSLLAQLSGSDGLAEFIVSVGLFLNRIILPFLMAVGLFIFLYYLARSFIIDVDNSDKREEAKSRALWGLAAFIVIVSIWGVVNMFVNGFNIDRERSICPDYLGNFCGNKGFQSGDSNLDFGNPSNLPSGGDGGSNADGDGGNATGGSNAASQSALGELLFGNYVDTADFNFRTGAPRATSSTISLSESTTCTDGFSTLQTAAGIEALQSAYLLTLTSAGTKWMNVTDSTSQTSVSYDAEWLQGPATVAQKAALVHTHPQATIDALDLPMSGHPSSIADLEVMCDDVVNDALFVTVDESGLWVTESTGAMCPRRASERDDLAVVSTLLHLATMDASARNNEFNLLYNWSDLPRNAQNVLRDYISTDFSTLSATAIITMADDIARDGGMKVTRMSAGDFCTAF